MTEPLHAGSSNDEFHRELRSRIRSIHETSELADEFPDFQAAVELEK